METPQGEVSKGFPQLPALSNQMLAIKLIWHRVWLTPSHLSWDSFVYGANRKAWGSFTHCWDPTFTKCKSKRDHFYITQSDLLASSAEIPVWFSVWALSWLLGLLTLSQSHVPWMAHSPAESGFRIWWMFKKFWSHSGSYCFFLYVICLLNYFISFYF